MYVISIKESSGQFVIEKEVNMKKRLLSIFVVVTILLSSFLPVYAEEAETDESDFSPIEHFLEQEGLRDLPKFEHNTCSSQAKSKTLPAGKGKIISNAWRTTFKYQVGNTYQWDYRVSAVYEGEYDVKRIRTTWQGSASLRNSASITLGISNSGVEAGTSSSWQSTSTVSKYWENSNGSSSSWYSSNMIVTPSSDYRNNTISIINTALVELDGDPMPYQISSGS